MADLKKQEDFLKKTLSNQQYNFFKSKSPDFFGGDKIYTFYANKELRDSLGAVLRHEKVGTAFMNLEGNSLGTLMHGTEFGNLSFSNKSNVSISPESLFTIMYNEGMISKDVNNVYFVSCFGGKNIGRDMKIYGTDINIKPVHNSRLPIYGGRAGKESVMFYTGEYTNEETVQKYLTKAEKNKELGKYKFNEDFTNTFGGTSKSNNIKESITPESFDYISEKYKDYFYDTNSKSAYVKDAATGNIKKAWYKKSLFDSKKYYKDFYGSGNQWAMSYEEAMKRFNPAEKNYIKAASNRDLLLKAIGSDGSSLRPISKEGLSTLYSTYSSMTEFYNAIGIRTKDYGKSTLFDETVEMAKDFKRFQEMYEANKGNKNFDIVKEIEKEWFRKDSDISNAKYVSSKRIINNNDRFEEIIRKQQQIPDKKPKPPKSENNIKTPKKDDLPRAAAASSGNKPSKEELIKKAMETIKEKQETVQEANKNIQNEKTPKLTKEDKIKKAIDEINKHNSNKEPSKASNNNVSRNNVNRGITKNSHNIANKTFIREGMNRYRKHMDDFTRFLNSKPKRPNTNNTRKSSSVFSEMFDFIKSLFVKRDSNINKLDSGGPIEAKPEKDAEITKKQENIQEKPTSKPENTEKTVENTPKNTQNTVKNSKIQQKKLNGNGKKAVLKGSKAGIIGALATTAFAAVGTIASSGSNSNNKNKKRNKNDNSKNNPKNDSLMYNDNNSDIAYNITKYRYGNTNITKPYVY